MKNSYLYVCIILLAITSCASKKDILFFQDIEALGDQPQNVNYETIIRPDDLLSIFISGNSPEVVALFNPLTTMGMGAQGPAARGLQTYVVESDGTIEFPLAGTIALGGLTRREAVEVIENELSVYVKDPVVNLRIINFTISVLGEVKAPSVFTITDERISVLEALGRAGDMTINGKRNSVKVIREENGTKTYGELDFTSIEVVNSPFYYLQQNDVVLVDPNGPRMQSAATIANAGIFISAIGLLISILTLVSR